MATIPLQTTFDTVVEHLRKQGKKSEGDGMCLYRGPGGLMCAAGCLIPDDRYEREFESKPITATTGNRIGAVLSAIGHDISLVGQLQAVHDEFEVIEWEEELECLADHFGLTYTPPVPA